MFFGLHFQGFVFQNLYQTKDIIDKAREAILLGNFADYKEKLKNDSVLQLDNFLLPKSLEKIQNEANALHSKAYYCSQNHTILLNQKNNTLDEQ